jgi:Flp pilus assembly protein TadB
VAVVVVGRMVVVVVVVVVVTLVVVALVVVVGSGVVWKWGSRARRLNPSSERLEEATR